MMNVKHKTSSKLLRHLFNGDQVMHRTYNFAHEVTQKEISERNKVLLLGNRNAAGHTPAKDGNQNTTIGKGSRLASDGNKRAVGNRLTGRTGQAHLKLLEV